MTLKERYKEICDEYLTQFAAAYFDGEADTRWIADDEGGIAEVNDYCFGFETIRYCVDNALTDTDELIGWYDYCLDAYEFNFPAPNFKSWHMGCPRLSDDNLAELRKANKQIIRAKEELDRLIAELKTSKRYD